MAGRRGESRVLSYDMDGKAFGPDDADVREEGMLLLSIRLIEDGTTNRTLMTPLRANSRVVVQDEGDLYVLIACCEVGEERLRDMIREFGMTSLADHSYADILRRP